MPATRMYTAEQGPEGLADALLRVNSVAELRALAPLPRDAQELMDKTVLKIGREGLVIANDVINAGLTFDISDPLSVLEVTWHRQNEAGAAKRTMIPGTRGEDWRLDFTPRTIPNYATWDNFSIPIRTLRASERYGLPLDTSQIEQATRNVNLAIEDAMINGAGLTVDANLTPGMLDAPGVQNRTYVGAWGALTGEQIYTEVETMIGLLQTKKMYGPYTLYVNLAYNRALSRDYKANSDKTIRQRLMEIDTGTDNKGNAVSLKIKVAPLLPTDRTLLVQLTSNVVDILNGQVPTPVTWDGPGGWLKNFVILAFQVPRVKDDYDANSGIVAGNV